MQISTIAVDVDGVLAEQVIPILARIKEKYGISLSKTQITEWDYPIGNTDIKTEIELAEMEEDFVKAMLPIEGCRETLDILARNYYVVIATSRHPLTDGWTVEWANTNGIKYSSFVNTRACGKSLPSVQILIDDYTKNIEEFVISGNSSRKAILFSQPWNRGHHSLTPFLLTNQVYTVNGWNEIAVLINKLNIQDDI